MVFFEYVSKKIKLIILVFLLVGGISATEANVILECENSDELVSIANSQNVSEDIEIDESVFYPTEKDRTNFLTNARFNFAGSTKQSGTDGTNVRPIFVLSIDGGGMRGLMPAIWLNKLDKELKTKNKSLSINNVFDYIGGTSIGGILSLGVASNVSSSKLVSLFKEHGNEIFSKKEAKKIKLKTVFGLTGARYKPDSLEGLLKGTFGEKTLRSIETNKVVVTSCSTTGEPRLFTNFVKEEDKDLKLWEVALCTSAAPTYFPAHQLIEGSYVDGGIWVNNPAPLVTANAVTYGHKGNFLPRKIYVLSLGTGDDISIELSQNAGIKDAGNIISLLMNSNSRGNHETMKEFFGPNNYFRINPALTSGIDLASTDKETIDILERLACREDSLATIKEFAEIIVTKTKRK